MKYGYCPKCGAEGISRERRIDGNDKCVNGHTYKSAESLRKPLADHPVKVFAQRLVDDIEKFYSKNWNDAQVLMYLQTELERAAHEGPL